MFRSKRQKLLFWVCLALLLLAAACAIAMAVLSGVLQSQRAAARWRGENPERFAQISCFFPIGSEKTEEEIYAFRETIDPKLLEAGLEEPETGRLWQDAYCARGTLNVTGARGSAEAAAYGVDGDFFLFHPLRLRSGSYISGEDLMGDRVVLDEELAWRLFGGFELEGMTLRIGGEPYYIAGVVARETDFADSRAHAETACIYLSYGAMRKNSEQIGIFCYELVCANPISGFAAGLVSEKLSEGGKYPVVENSGRFGLEALFGVLGDFGERSMNRYGVIYPYWENAARLVEDYMALLLVLLLVFLALPAVCLALLLRQLAHTGRQALQSGAARARDARDTRRYERAAGKSAAREKRKAAGKRAKALRRRAQEAVDAPEPLLANAADAEVVEDAENVDIDISLEDILSEIADDIDENVDIDTDEEGM